MKDIFAPTDILLPDGVPMETWAVVACDQFSSEREYWERVERKVGESPSTYRMIIPEAFLEEIDEKEEILKISATMDDYSSRGVFKEFKDSMIYVERTQPDGRVRRGLVGAIELDEYDFACDKAAILASEGTVLDRLPPRIRVRSAASFELPHIMTFIDDKDATVIEPLAERADGLPLLYDFDLLEGGGHIRGMRLSDGDVRGVLDAMNALYEKSGKLLVVADGNHSLAAAKVYWDELKKGLSEAEAKSHPARRALLEVNNIYDPAISFEAIHRVVFDVDSDDFVKRLKEASQPGDDYEMRWVSGGSSGVIGVAANCIGDMLASMQEFLDDYVERVGCRVDYIHGDDSAFRLAQGERSLALILPAMDKSELFATVTARGVFPKKSFSVGHARDKRYYLECRKIT